MIDSASPHEIRDEQSDRDRHRENQHPADRSPSANLLGQETTLCITIGASDTSEDYKDISSFQLQAVRPGDQKPGDHQRATSCNRPKSEWGPFSFPQDAE